MLWLLAKTDSLKPPRNLNPGISPSSEYAVLKAMAVNADLRFQRVEEFIEAFSQPEGELLPSTQLVSSPMESAVAASTVASVTQDEFIHPDAE